MNLLVHPGDVITLQANPTQFFYGGPDRVVVKGRCPSAIRKAVARILVRPAPCLYDTIKSNVFKYGNFSHKFVSPCPIWSSLVYRCPGFPAGCLTFTI